jgi:catechol 2,3-dioxygenase-like lactoylglutathione lyase family enzyme
MQVEHRSHDLMTEQFRLAQQRILTFVATCDPDRAKKFYRDTLGLPLVCEELPFALVFDVNGITLRVTIVEKLSPAPFTVLGWQVPDIAIAVTALEEAGVHFEHYPGMPQDELGIWTSPGGAKVAWFKDPDGNTLSLSQH